MADTLSAREFSRPRETPSAVLGKLLFFTVLMVVIPISTYYITRSYVFEGLLSYSHTTSSIYAAIPAVIAVNCVIAMYVYVAWNSEPWSDASTPSQAHSKRE